MTSTELMYARVRELQDAGRVSAPGRVERPASRLRAALRRRAGR